ncbi:MAG TPA: Rne/Rng family ribonuclease, partial [Humisphaera sp.]|nr:Rne/Rng family ribonuclease [Humisphaera sp.]
MPKEMLINVSEGEECRIALVEDGVLEELYMERTSSTSHVGNVYKGRVMNVEPSIQAAFVDFGLGRNGFLHISDLLPSYFGHKGDDVQEFVGKKMARRDRPPIQRCLRRGDEIIVQVIKEGIGTKGPTLSAYLSISGKMLVMMPGVNGRGVSRKIEDEEERRRLKQILVSLDPPEDCGFIIRTESVGKSKAEIERDLKYLARLWEQIKKKRDSVAAPVELYTEGDLVTRTVRDVFSGDVDRIIIDNEDVARRVSDVIKLSNPRAKNKVDLYDAPIPLFHKYGIEAEIERMYSRHVPLRNGGSLVIDSTEAIVAIDVNSGKNRENSDAEMTAFRTDMEAADEICRQLKLRDLGGVIIVDFIDLRHERHRRELQDRLDQNLSHDRAKTKVLPMSQFGIIEMTRQRMRPSLKRSVYFDCPHCKGAGLVKTPESMSLDVMRRLAIAIHDTKVARVELAVNPDVAFSLQNKKRQSLANLEWDTRKRILIRGDATLGLDEMRLELFDARDGVVIISELASTVQTVPHKTQLNTRPQEAQKRDGRHGKGGRQDGDHRPGQRPAPVQGRHSERELEREDFDRDVEELEDRSEEVDRDRDEAVGQAPIPSSGGARLPAPRFDERADESDLPSDSNDDRMEESGAEDLDESRGQAGAEGLDDAAEQTGVQPIRTGPPDNRGLQGDRPFEGEEGDRPRRRRRRRRGRGRGAQQNGANGQPLPQPAGDNRRPPLEGDEIGAADTSDAADPRDVTPHDDFDDDRETGETRDEYDRDDSGEVPVADERGERDTAPPRDDRGERDEVSARGDRGGRGDASNRDNRGGRNDAMNRDNRTGRNDAPNRDNRGGRNDASNRDNRGGRNDNTNRDNRGGRNEAVNRDNRGGRNDAVNRDNRGGRNDAQNRDNRGGRNDAANRDNRGSNRNDPPA